MPGTLYVDIVSPDGSVFRGEAAGVRAPGVQGSFEVLHNHAPMIAVFDIGPLIVTDEAGEQITFATSGGFLEVVDNTVTVLAETAEPGTAIDVERAKAAEQRAVADLRAAVDRQEAERALQRARNRLRVAMGSVGIDRSRG